VPAVSLGFTPVTRRPYDAPLLRGVDGDTVNIAPAPARSSTACAPSACRSTRKPGGPRSERLT
jgi:hypothetical protein